MMTPTHRWVAERMGYSISGVSLLRNGKREPAMKTMRRVEQTFGWPLQAQMEAYVAGKYAQEFERAVREAVQTLG